MRADLAAERARRAQLGRKMLRRQVDGTRRRALDAREAFRATCAAFRQSGTEATRATMLAAATEWRRAALAARTIERAPGARGVA